MDYYQTMRNDYIHKAMYPEDPMRIDWIPKGPPTGTLTIKPKDKCAPRFVSKIEGNAVEESAKVFFEGIVDAQPNPKFSWYFEDELIIPGQRGWEEAEVHHSRKMSTLILKYAREHHMGKYTLVATNQLGSAECNCDLIVRKKQFPPVFWQRLYNVNGEGSRRFVGEVEVGGWPVPQVYWYKVLEDGEEVEVKSKTHTENWNGNPNKYVPDSRIEVRQVDQIRHVIIFHQVSEGDSGLYRVRAVNALGEAECEAELYFDECGSSTDLYLPPLWKERKRLTWKDEDKRIKPFVGHKEPELTADELAEMRKKSGGVPLNRIMEYLASLPNYVPAEKFRHMDRIPFKLGVDERDYRPDRKGGKCSYPSVFKKGNFTHSGYRSDALGRILPVWFDKKDPRSRDSSDFKWKSVHPDLYIPNIPTRSTSPEAPPVWETDEALKKLAELLNTMGCHMPNVAELRQAKAGNKTYQNNQYVTEMQTEKSKAVSHHTQKSSRIEKFSYIMPKQADTEHFESVHKDMENEHQGNWNERLTSNTAGAQSNAADFTTQFMSQMYEKKDNMSFPELSYDRPALPPKTKIMNSPSRILFSPTESIEGNSFGTASIKTIEFLPVKEKIKLIAAQQEELLRKEEASGSAGHEKKHRGVRILPPSPVTVRKMSVDSELYHYDEVVTRSTPVTQVLERMKEKPASPVPQDIFSAVNNVGNFSSYEKDYSTADSGFSQSTYRQCTTKSSVHQESMVNRHEVSQSPAMPELAIIDIERESKQQQLAKASAAQGISLALDLLIADSDNIASRDSFLHTEAQLHQSYTSSSTVMKTTHFSETQKISQNIETSNVYESSAEECRRSFEEAELEAMALESETSKSFSKQSSIIESCSTQSFVMQEHKAPLSKTDITSKETLESESSFRSRKPIKSSSFVRAPESLISPETSVSSPNTPMSQRRRLRINQSPKPTESDTNPKYKESPNTPFQPGFYRKPQEDPEKSHVFQLVRRNSSRTRVLNERSTSGAESRVSNNNTPNLRTSQASSNAYEGDYESELEDRR